MAEFDAAIRATALHLTLQRMKEQGVEQGIVCDTDAHCKKCDEAIYDVDYVEVGDERHYTCHQCWEPGVLYWHDDPGFRGWK